MKILHITPDFNFAVNFVKPICLEQIKLGSEVTVISTLAFYSINSEIDEFYLTFEGQNTKLKLKLLNLRLRKFEFNLLKSYWNFVKMLKADSYDTIIFHTTIDTTLPIILSKFFSKAKRIYFNHGVPGLGYSGLIKTIFTIIEKINILSATSTFTIGPSMRQELNKISNYSKPTYIRPGSACGIELTSTNFQDILIKRKDARNRLSFSHEAKIVIFAGRPVRRKGIYDLIKAWIKLDLDESSILLLAGPELNDLKGIDCPSNVYSLGYVSNMKDYYLSADVLCVPSYHEGLGYTYIEAASAGCVPICSKIIGPTDFVIHGLTGLTVRPGVVDDIHDSIKELLNNDTMRLFISEHSFEASLKFDRKIIAPKVAKALM